VTEREWDDCTEPGKMLDFLCAEGGVSDRKLRLFAVGCVRGAWDVLEPDLPRVTACCRRAIDVAEAYADGVADREAMRSARGAVRNVPRGADEEPEEEWTVEAAVAVTEQAGDAAATRTADLLGQVEDFGEAQADTIWVSGLTVVHSREDLAQLIAGHRARGLPLGSDWEHTLQHWDAVREKNGWADDARKVSRKRQAATLRDIAGNPFRPIAVDPAWLAWHGGAAVHLARAVYEERELPSGHLDVARLAVLAGMLEEAGCCDAGLLDHLRGPGPHVRGCWAVDLLLAKE
jgi:hypothetical protein